VNPFGESLSCARDSNVQRLQDALGYRTDQNAPFKLLGDSISNLAVIQSSDRPHRTGSLGAPSWFQVAYQTT